MIGGVSGVAWCCGLAVGCLLFKDRELVEPATELEGLGVMGERWMSKAAKGVDPSAGVAVGPPVP